MKRIKGLMALIAMISFSSQAQQDPQYTHYMYNTTVINPAYAGSRGAMSIFGLHRSQWVGLEGASTTSTLRLSMHNQLYSQFVSHMDGQDPA